MRQSAPTDSQLKASLQSILPGTSAIEATQSLLAELAQRIASGDEIDVNALPEASRSNPAVQRLLQFARVADQLGANSQLGTELNRQKGGDTQPFDPALARLGPYRLRRLIGHGGMGMVWLGERDDGAVQLQVAIKCVHVGVEHFAARLRVERQILARLTHTNIARFVDAGVDADGLPWLAMEYVDGVPITDWCEQQQLGLKERVQLFQHVCSAVAYAHRELVVHRDLKPGNVLVNSEGQAKLLDFGIAKLIDGSTAETTAVGMTPAYAAPEQLQGQVVSASADVYALGLLLYRLLSGALPDSRQSESAIAVLAKLHQEEHARASDSALLMQASLPYAAQSIVGDLDAIISKALRASPDARYGSVADFSADLDRYLRHLPVQARPPTKRYRAMRFLQRYQVAMLMLAVAVAALIAGTGVAVWQLRRAQVAEHQAQTESKKALAGRDFLLKLLSSTNPYQASNAPQDIASLYVRALPQVNTALAGDVETQTKIFYQFGRSLMMLDHEPQALQALQMGEALYQQHGVAITDPARLTHHRTMVDLYLRLRAMQPALVLNRQHRSACDSNHPPAASDCLTLSNGHIEVLRQYGNWREADALVAQNTQLAVQHDLKKRYESIYTVYLKGMLDRDQGRTLEATQAFLELTDRTLADAPPDHPGLLTDLLWLAYIAIDMGAPELASPLCDYGKVGRTALFGRQSRMVALPNVLAGTLAMQQGHDEVAEAIFSDIVQHNPDTEPFAYFREEAGLWLAILRPEAVTDQQLLAIEQSRIGATHEQSMRLAELRLQMVLAYIQRGQFAPAQTKLQQVHQLIDQPQHHSQSAALRALALLAKSELAERLQQPDVAKAATLAMHALLKTQQRRLYNPLKRRFEGAVPDIQQQTLSAIQLRFEQVKARRLAITSTNAP